MDAQDERDGVSWMMMGTGMARRGNLAATTDAGCGNEIATPLRSSQ